MVDRDLLSENSFLVELGALRASSHDLLENPPGRNATSGCPSDAIALLQLALSTEILCVCRYTMISLSHDGLKYAALGAEFQEQANDERRHMEMIADCIEKLGGTPAFDSGRPISLNSIIISSEKPLITWLKENLDAEQYVIAHYRDLIGYFDKSDPKTSKILAAIIRDEEEHSQDMQDLLKING